MHPATPSGDYLARHQKRIEVVREALAQIAAPQGHITLEIGSGHGHFLTAYASAHPDKICVGIDIMQDRYLRSEKKRTRARLPNLHFLRAAAEDFVPAMPPNLLLEEIFILFPDPWPKRRHHKNRVIQTHFLRSLAEKTKSGARLYFRTDDMGYFNAAESTLRIQPAWQLDSALAWPFELTTVFQSRAAGYQSLVASRKHVIDIKH